MIKIIYNWIINPFIKRFPETPNNIVNARQPEPDAEFDIENESVFAVERDKYDKKTIIGYYPSNGADVIEWYTICSIKQHNNFIKRFRSKLFLKTQNDKDNFHKDINLDEKRSE